MLKCRGSVVQRFITGDLWVKELRFCRGGAAREVVQRWCRGCGADAVQRYRGAKVQRQRCRCAEVQRFRVGAGAAGKKVVWLYKGAKEVQSRCRGCAEAVQRCRGSAEVLMQQRCRGVWRAGEMC